MTEPREIRRKPSGPSGSKGTPNSQITLPADVVAGAGRRLSLAALAYAGAYLLVYGANRSTALASHQPFHRGPVQWIGNSFAPVGN